MQAERSIKEVLHSLSRQKALQRVFLACFCLFDCPQICCFIVVQRFFIPLHNVSVERLASINAENLKLYKMQYLFLYYIRMLLLY